MQPVARIRRDAAVEVLRQIYTNDAGPLPFPAADMLPEVTPMLIVWGDNDTTYARLHKMAVSPSDSSYFGPSGA